MKEIAIYGAGGVGVDTISLVENINSDKPIWKIVGIFDDAVPIGTKVLGYPVIGDIKALNQWNQDLHLTLAISDPVIKRKLAEEINNERINYPTLIHPSVINAHARSLVLGKGTMLGAGSVIMGRVTIGDHVLVYLNATIGHDSKIGSYGSIMPGANVSGNVKLDSEVFIGTGAQVVQNLKIGKNATVGAGAVVIKNVKNNQTVVGVPAVPLMHKKK